MHGNTGRENLDGAAKKVGRRCVDLPAFLSPSGFEGAGRQNPGSSQSCARPIYE
jgi:hypothetical protein